MKRTFYFDAETEHWQEGICRSPISETLIEQLKEKRKDRFFVPYQWTVQTTATSVLEVVLDILSISFHDGEIHSIQEKEWMMEYDFTHGKMQAWPIAFLKEREKGWVKYFHCPESTTFPDMLGAQNVEIPATVTEIALEYLQELAECEFGFRPTYMGRIHGIKHVIAFFHRPLDLNIYLLRYVIGEPYEQLFPRNQRDNYRPLCRFFQIHKPPKSLRRFYGECPENIVAYVLLRQMGFRDINVIRRFFQREVLFGYRLLKLSYHPTDGILSDDSARYMNPYLEWLRRFCQWYLLRRNEVHLANCLRPLAVAEEWDQDTIDILRMFVVTNLDMDDSPLRQNTIRRLLREGFTFAVHDDMMHDLMDLLPRRERGRINWNDIPNTPIHYTDIEQGYEAEMEGYRFSLPKETDELREYGKAFHNCVASYRAAVLEKRTLILVMMRGEKYIACIEIQQRRIVQALGSCNQRLPVEVHEVLKRWAENKKIVYDVRY